MSTAQQMITKAKSFDPTKITFDEPQTNSRGGKSVSMRLNGAPIVLQIPLMLTWGVNEWADDQTGNVKYNLALQFDPHKSDSQAKFLNVMKTMEDKLKDDMVKNSKKWFGKSKMSKDVVEALMYPMLKYRKNKETGDPDLTANPTLQVKVPFWDGRFNIEIYDMNRQPLYLQPKKGSQSNRAVGQSEDSTPVDFIPKASHIKGLIRCSGLWFVGGKCGCSWQIIQVNVRPPTRLVGSGQCMIMDDSDDDEMLDDLKEKDENEKKEEEVDEEESTSPTFDDDDEDDDEEQTGEQVEPTPPKKKKKKVVRRKKTSE